MSVLSLAFLAVSAISVTIQLASWYRMKWMPPSVERRRVARTIISRLVAAVAYLTFGSVALVSRESSAVVGLILFTLVQGLWWANSLADTQRSRAHQLEEEDHELHRWLKSLRPPQ